MLKWTTTLAAETLISLVDMRLLVAVASGVQQFCKIEKNQQTKLKRQARFSFGRKIGMKTLGSVLAEKLGWLVVFGVKTLISVIRLNFF